MAKRFTDSDKWKDMTFLRKLPAEYKLLWLYMWDDCDHAGIWHVDLDTAFTKLGIKFSLEKIRGLFAGKVVEFENGAKMFIPDFIAFQYGKLNPENKVHRSVLNTLESLQIKGLTSPLEGAKDKNKDMDIIVSTVLLGKIRLIMQGDFNLQDMAMRVRGFTEEQFHFAIDDFLSTESNGKGLEREQGEIHKHFTNWCRTHQATIKARKDLKPAKKQLTQDDKW